MFEITAVSCGAILSSYQKNRLENVCRRLNMVPLCYLWGADQKRLFDEMIDANLEAIIVKVATLGLNKKHLGKQIKEACDRRDYFYVQSLHILYMA